MILQNFALERSFIYSYDIDKEVTVFHFPANAGRPYQLKPFRDKVDIYIHAVRSAH